jgi:hypothetical protein
MLSKKILLIAIILAYISCYLILYFYESNNSFFGKFKFIINSNSNPNDIINDYINEIDINYKHIYNFYKENEGVVFLKTHKTGGSTLSRILWRQLCDIEHRNCFLPTIDNYGKIWDFNSFNDWSVIKNGKGSTFHKSFPFDVWVHHVKYSNKMKQVVPTTNKIISIVRNPSLRFISAWDWYEHEKTLGISFEKFLNISIEQYINNNNNNNKCLIPWAVFSYWKNSFSHNSCIQFKYRTGLDATVEEIIGISKDNDSFQELFESLIDNIYNGKIFLLVLDRFDESLLIMGKLLGWNLQSLLYISQKVSSEKKVKNDNINEIKNDNIKLNQLKLLQPYDNALFNAANHLLDKYIDEYSNIRNSDKFMNSSINTEVHSPSLSHSFSLDLKLLRLGLLRIQKICKQQEIIKLENITNIDRYCASIMRDNNEAMKYIWEKNESISDYIKINLSHLFIE